MVIDRDRRHWLRRLSRAGLRRLDRLHRWLYWGQRKLRRRRLGQGYWLRLRQRLRRQLRRRRLLLLHHDFGRLDSLLLHVPTRRLVPLHLDQLSDGKVIFDSVGECASQELNIAGAQIQAFDGLDVIVRLAQLELIVGDVDS